MSQAFKNSLIKLSLNRPPQKKPQTSTNPKTQQQYYFGYLFCHTFNLFATGIVVFTHLHGRECNFKNSSWPSGIPKTDALLLPKGGGGFSLYHWQQRSTGVLSWKVMKKKRMQKTFPSWKTLCIMLKNKKEVSGKWARDLDQGLKHSDVSCSVVISLCYLTLCLLIFTIPPDSMTMALLIAMHILWLCPWYLSVLFRTTIQLNIFIILEPQEQHPACYRVHCWSEILPHQCFSSERDSSKPAPSHWPA